MDLNILVIEEDLKELGFEDYIKRRGFKCIKLVKNNEKEIEKELRRIRDINKKYWEIEDFISFELKYCFKNGSPDFFIYKEDCFYICEFKSKNDNLRVNQIIWIKENPDIPILIAICNPKNPLKDFKNLEFETKHPFKNEELKKV